MRNSTLRFLNIENTMNENLINKLQSYGYTTNNKGYVYKYSQSKRTKEVAGQLNNAGVYFYANNVSPFKNGQNTIKDIFGENKPFTYTPYIAPATKDYNFTFENYKTTTQPKNQFSIYLKAFNKEYLSKELNTNLYDLRGIKNGNFKDAVLFPYTNYDNDFLTAKIVKYNSNTGKRIKENFSNSWFHSDKSIKNQLGIKDKISKSINCFFGEHLLPFNNKPVVIVEAEKTAIILSLIYKNIVFIASGGVAKLKGLEWSFLTNRQVFLFPDNNAIEWFKIAEERGWWVSEVLENKGSKGSDVVDYLTTYKTNEENASIWWELHEQLYNIDAGELTTESIECTSLNFENKKELSFNYCLPIPVNENNIPILTYYWQNAKGKAFKGKHFQIYEDDFQILNANIDFNKSYKTEFGWQQMDANKFLIQLEKTFRITKYLNTDKNHLAQFNKVLYNLIENSNHRFNISYIERVIIPIWDAGENDIQKYIKYRNWRFASSDKIEQKDFVPFLNNDQKLFKTNQCLIKLKPLLDKGEFILPEYIGLHQRRENTFIDDLIREYNQKVLGCKTLRNYKSKLEVSKYLNLVVENINRLEQKTVCTRKFASTYSNSNMRWQENEYTFKMPSIRLIKENTLVGQNVINEYLNFKLDNDILIDLKEKVNYHIENPQEFNFERTNGRIEIIVNDIVLNKETISITTEDAFNYELDLSSSMLNVSEDNAKKQNTNFLFSWILFNNPNLTDTEIENIKYCPMLFFETDNTLLYAS